MGDADSKCSRRSSADTLNEALVVGVIEAVEHGGGIDIKGGGAGMRRGAVAFVDGKRRGNVPKNGGEGLPTNAADGPKKYK